MKVTVDARYLESEVGGIAGYIKELNYYLLKQGHTPILISTKSLKDLPTGSQNIVLKKSFHWFFWEQFKLLFLLYKLKPDLYHAAGNRGVPIFSKIPTITTVHDIIPLILPDYFNSSKLPSLAKKMYKLSLSLTLKKSKLVLVTTEQLGELLIEKFKLSPEKIRVVPMGINDKFFKQQRHGFLNETKIEAPYLLSHGGLDKRKNLEGIIKAWPRLLNLWEGKKNYLKLVITGNNKEYKKYLQKLAKENNINRYLLFLDNVSEDDMVPLIDNASLVVYPTFAEGFGLPLIEAMARGVPVMVSEIEQLKNLGQDVPIYVDPYSVDSIALGIVKGLKKGNRSKLIKGRNLAKKLSIKKTITKTIGYYMECINL